MPGTATAQAGPGTREDYERAAARFGAAGPACIRARREAERIISAAEAEYDAAERDLIRYELRPGIPLPEYR